MILYPDGYGTRMVSMVQLRAKHEPKMHPEFARRLFAWLESRDGFVGIGGGWRETQPVKPGFAPPGRSFHESQRFASGLVAYAAVDLVVAVDGGVHRAPTWDETDGSRRYGLHTFVTGEPWHMQALPMRGWRSWVDQGRRDPEFFVLPSEPTIEDEEIIVIAFVATPPAELGPAAPWLLQVNGSTTYCSTETAEQAKAQGIPWVAHNAEQYAWLRKSAGL